MYIVKDGERRLIDDATFPYWRDLGWAEWGSAAPTTAELLTQLGPTLSSTYVGAGQSLTTFGLTDATTDIATVFAAAIAAGARHIVVPAREAAWPALAKILLTDVWVRFEPGARISFDHAGQGAELLRSRLTGASFTSIHTGPATIADATSATYGYPAREVVLRDDCTIDGGYYQEYATTGLHVLGAHVRYVGPVTIKHIRHQQGWGNAVHHDTEACHDVRGTGPFIIEDCDRGIETEDGAHDVVLSGGGHLKDIYPKGYAGQASAATYATYTFVLDGHSHEGGGGVQGIVYDGTWVIENCGGGVTFIRSSGTNDADLPRDCRVGEVRIIGRGLASGYEDIAMQGRNNHVGRAHFEVGSGVAGGTFRVRGYPAGSSGNTVGAVASEGAATAALTYQGLGAGLSIGAPDRDFCSTLGSDPGLMAAVAAGGNVTWPTASQASLIRIRARRTMTITKLVWLAGTASGNYDIGLYDASGTRLWSKGSTPFPTGLQTETVSPAVTVREGDDFYVAMVADNTTASMKGAAVASAELTKSLTGAPVNLGVGSAIPLPATVALGSTAVLRVPAITVREA